MVIYFWTNCFNLAAKYLSWFPDGASLQSSKHQTVSIRTFFRTEQNRRSASSFSPLNCSTLAWLLRNWNQGVLQKTYRCPSRKKKTNHMTSVRPFHSNSATNECNWILFNFWIVFFLIIFLFKITNHFSVCTAITVTSCKIVLELFFLF